jgi:predicted  nucleic acid-binding Zn-ribbon protein
MPLASSLNRLYNPIMSQAQTLYRLQQIDSQLDQIHTRTSEIERILVGNSELEVAKANLSAVQDHLNAELLSLHTAEQTVQDQCLKIEQTEAALYGGKIRLPKELQDLQNEVAALKKYLVVLEDRQLAHMEAVETAQDRIHEAEDKFDQVQASWTEKTAHLHSELSQFQTLLARLEAERNAALNPISPELLTTYETLRMQRNGVAVVKVLGKSCAACGTTLTPAVVQSVQSSANIIRCPSCNRILYSG